ncbi:MAG: hypothetical protein OEZ38_04310 [Gammaproteobacteria bacterium]|nr:hypothetical protein [Gammaproteobacteria bacterium]
MRYLLFLLLSFPCLAVTELSSSPEKNEPELSADSKYQLAKIEELLDFGAPDLALHFIKTNQPEFTEASLNEWLVWEEKRISLLEKMEDWQQIFERISGQRTLWQPGSLSVELKNQFIGKQIEASLQINKPEQAMSLLRDELWSGNVVVSQIEEWRRLIIRSYLDLGLTADAQSAMRSYHLDYGQDRLVTDQWLLLQSQILIDSGYASRAIKLLEDKKAPALQAQLLLAKLKAKSVSSDKVEKQARKQLKKARKDQRAQSIYWYIILRAAVVQQDYLVQVEAVENLLELKAEKYLRTVFSQVDSDVSADALWDSYLQAGLHLSNQFKLLRGDDGSWYVKANQLAKKKPRQARILFAFLALNGHDDAHRKSSFERLAGLLEKRKKGLEIIYRLFMEAGQITSLDIIPESIRYTLVDYALSHANLKIAATLMAGLAQPPEGKDNFDWNLRRSRILVLGGQYQEATDILIQMISRRKQLKEIQVDQYLQVVFDLQNVQAHDQALKAFKVLEQYPLSKKVERELAFWKAESYQALNDHQQAAWLFLKSAQPIEEEIDPWYHTSIFKAAEAMGKAGLIRDAREQFIKLLRITASEARKAVIRQRLQQLRLQQSHKLGESAE